MRALTIWPEWAWAIDPRGLAKDVENRIWDPTRRGLPIGDRFAIHAGKYVGGGASFSVRQVAIDGLVYMACEAGWECSYPNGDMEHDRAFLLSEERDSGLLVLRHANFEFNEIPRSAVVGVATLAGVRRDSPSPWAVPGQFHWELADVIYLPEPVPCRGAQGLWHLPEEVEEKVRAQLPEKERA